jgi:hypothetical protein
METVSVEWAPGHMAPYVSKYNVEPLVLLIVQRYMTDFRNSISSNPDEDVISKDLVLKEIDKMLREIKGGR